MPLILSSFFFQLTTFISFIAATTDGIVVGVMVLLLNYHQHMRINKINYEIEKVSKPNCPPYEISKAIKRFNEEHNRFIMQLWNYNHYSRNVYFAFVFCSFPINLLAMHQIIFEPLDMHIRAFFCTCGLGQ